MQTGGVIEGGGSPTARLRPGLWLGLAVLLIGFGVTMAALVERSGGVSVTDVRFRGEDGAPLSALLYRPAAATARSPAPGILAVHGYLNSRETQSPFAIEFARRGYVVLALDQRGHGYSGGAAATHGFGGPDGLRYLRSLPFVDASEIGLEGHSMGGWAVLAAAAAMPDAYRSMVLEGSSTGAPFARTGDPTWPKNLEVVYSRYDEFAPLMWGAARAADIGSTPKLEALFGVSAPVVAGRLYGDPARGSGRRLTQPLATHPGDHLSTVAVADAADWFARTLKGGVRRPAQDQVWWWKEIGTGLALLGFGCLLLGLFDLFLALPPFAALRGAPPTLLEARGWRWATVWLATAFIPALTYYLTPLNLPLIKPSALFPQAVSNALALWALVNVALSSLIGLALGVRPTSRGQPFGLCLGLAALVLAPAYLALWGAGALAVDFRFWVVALRPLSGRQALAFLSYVVPFTLFVAAAFRSLAALGQGTLRSHYLSASGAMASGFLLTTGAQYAILVFTGALPFPTEALNAIVAIQFVPLLLGLGVLGVHTWRRTGRSLPGALIGGLFVTWYVVSGTATHVG